MAPCCHSRTLFPAELYSHITEDSCWVPTRLRGALPFAHCGAWHMAACGVCLSSKLALAHTNANGKQSLPRGNGSLYGRRTTAPVEMLVFPSFSLLSPLPFPPVSLGSAAAASTCGMSDMLGVVCMSGHISDPHSTTFGSESFREFCFCRNL